MLQNQLSVGLICYHFPHHTANCDQLCQSQNAKTKTYVLLYTHAMYVIGNVAMNERQIAAETLELLSKNVISDCIARHDLAMKLFENALDW